MCELDKDGDGTVAMWEVVQHMHRVFACTAQQQSSTGEAEVGAAPEPRAGPV